MAVAYTDPSANDSPSEKKKYKRSATPAIAFESESLVVLVESSFTSVMLLLYFNR